MLFNITYTQTTPESVDVGEHDDAGFVVCDIDYDAHDIARLIVDGGYRYWSVDPINKDAVLGCHVWLSTDYETISYEEGCQEQRSLHPCNGSAARLLWRVWEIVG